MPRWRKIRIIRIADFNKPAELRTVEGAGGKGQLIRCRYEEESKESE